jgi:hypothetical protein
LSDALYDFVVDLEDRAKAQRERIDEPRGCERRLHDVKFYADMDGKGRDLRCGEKRDPSFVGVELCPTCQAGKSYAIGARDVLTNTARELRALLARLNTGPTGGRR